MAGITITREELARYQELRSQRLELDRQSKALEVEEKQIAEKVREQLLKCKKTSAKRFGWLLALVPQKGTVKWKDEFIRAVGAEEAARLQEEATEKDPKVQLTPPGEEAE